MGTPFSAVYNHFLGKITDDMYLELTPQDTVKDLQIMILDALPGFEFPRINLYDFMIDVETKHDNEVNEKDFVIGYLETEENDAPNVLIDHSYFIANLTFEEIDILATLMLEAWVQRQVTSIENTRMKYSGSDFKMTSQANHLQKLLSLLSEIQRQSHHKQRLYKRREISERGTYESTWYMFGENQATND